MGYLPCFRPPRRMVMYGWQTSDRLEDLRFIHSNTMSEGEASVLRLLHFLVYQKLIPVTSSLL